MSKNLSKFEFGYGLTFNYYDIKNNEFYSKIFSLDIVDIFQRYNAKSNKDGLFVELSMPYQLVYNILKPKKQNFY